MPVSGIKSLIIDKPNLCLFINGEYFNLDNDTYEFAILLASGFPLTTNKVKSFMDCLKNTQLLTSILNMVFWYIE